MTKREHDADTKFNRGIEYAGRYGKPQSWTTSYRERAGRLPLCELRDMVAERTPWDPNLSIRAKQLRQTQRCRPELTFKNYGSGL